MCRCRWCPNCRRPPPAPRTPQAAGPPQPGSVVEVIHGEDGAVFAPDVKFTEVDHEFATLVGAYAGYVFGGEVMFGGGGYWQANSTNGQHIAYGGPVVEWRALRGKTISFNLHALVGGGTTYSDYHDGYYGYDHGVYAVVVAYRRGSRCTGPAPRARAG